MTRRGLDHRGGAVSGEGTQHVGPIICTRAQCDCPLTECDRAEASPVRREPMQRACTVASPDIAFA